MVAGRIGDGDTVGTMVRMPSSLRDRIKHSADTYGRSMNSEIVATLEEKYPEPTFEDVARELTDIILSAPQSERKAIFEKFVSSIRQQSGHTLSKERLAEVNDLLKEEP